MFVYEKKLQYPVRIQNVNPQLAAIIISQYGGPDGELGASLRYLSQRYSMPYDALKGLLTDIGTEELGHLEMVGAIVHQLTRTLTEEQMRAQGFARVFCGESRSGVLSFVPREIDCEEAAQRLADAGIAVRAGLHCAPTAHRTAGTLQTGTVRLSVSPFNTDAELRTFLAVCKNLF